MKNLKYLILTLALTPLCLFAEAEDLPKEFKDADVLAQVLEGKVVEDPTQLINEEREYRSVAMAFFKKVSVAEFQKQAVDHANYENFVPFVHESAGKRSKNENEYEYQVTLRFKKQVFTLDIYIDGKQKLVVPKDAVSLGSVHSEVVTVKGFDSKQIEFVRQDSYLYPYQGGILVVEKVHFKLGKEFNIRTAKTLKDRLENYFTKYVEAFRDRLQNS